MHHWKYNNVVYVQLSTLNEFERTVHSFSLGQRAYLTVSWVSLQCGWVHISHIDAGWSPICFHVPHFLSSWSCVTYSWSYHVLPLLISLPSHLVDIIYSYFSVLTYSSVHPVISQLFNKPDLEGSHKLCVYVCCSCLICLFILFLLFSCSSLGQNLAQISFHCPVGLLLVTPLCLDCAPDPPSSRGFNRHLVLLFVPVCIPVHMYTITMVKKI